MKYVAILQEAAEMGRPAGTPYRKEFDAEDDWAAAQRLREIAANWVTVVLACRVDCEIKPADD